MIKRRYFMHVHRLGTGRGHTLSILFSQKSWRPDPGGAYDGMLEKLSGEIGVPVNELVVVSFNRV